MLAIIIPTRNAENSLSRNLLPLAGERVIVSDAGSSDETLSIAIKYDAVLAIGTEGRGPQLARGGKFAAVTGAEWMLFLHSDTRLPNSWREIVQRHIESHPSKAAYFRYAVQAKGFLPRLQSALVALRCWAWGMPYGDQGLLMPISIYQAVGGFSDLPLFEDVDMINRLKAKIGRRNIRPLPAAIHTDVSAYHAQGWWTRGYRNFKLYRAFQKGPKTKEAVEALMREYYGERK